MGYKRHNGVYSYVSVQQKKDTANEKHIDNFNYNDFIELFEKQGL